MRISRSIYLPQSGATVHKFWRAYNREFFLALDSMKDLYLAAVSKALIHKSVASGVKLHGFCIMSNHAHILLKYSGGLKNFSSFMRIAHSRFGQSFNKITGRQGPVAYDRPKTPLVQESTWNQMRVQFYIEANPLRAKMVKNLKLYKYSSFRFYAWGIKSEFSKSLCIPQWYLDLGSSAKLRQSRYRSLFNKYLKEILSKDLQFTVGKFIGDFLWIEQRSALLLNRTQLFKPSESG
jgi:putative transposase